MGKVFETPDDGFVLAVVQNHNITHLGNGPIVTMAAAEALFSLDTVRQWEMSDPNFFIDGYEQEADVFVFLFVCKKKQEIDLGDLPYIAGRVNAELNLCNGLKDVLIGNFVERDA